MSDRAPLAKWATLGVVASVLALTTSSEGKSYRAYPDPGYGWQVPTICYGHTKGVKRGDVATEAQCQQWLKEDMAKAMQEADKYIKATVTRKQASVLADFQFNTGGLGGSQIAAKLNAGDCKGAAIQFNAAPMLDKRTKMPIVWMGKPIIDRETGTILLNTGEYIKKWTTSNGIPLGGLIKRRNWNRAEFEADCHGSSADTHP